MGPFNSDDTVFVLGDGNLSFSLSLANNLAKNTNFKLLATTFLTLDELKEAYGEEKIMKTINALNAYDNVTVHHGVDATNLQATPDIFKNF